MDEMIFYRAALFGGEIETVAEFLSPETMLGDWLLYDTAEDCMAREVNA